MGERPFLVRVGVYYSKVVMAKDESDACLEAGRFDFNDWDSVEEVWEAEEEGQ